MFFSDVTWDDPADTLDDEQLDFIVDSLRNDNQDIDDISNTLAGASISGRSNNVNSMKPRHRDLLRKHSASSLSVHTHTQRSTKHRRNLSDESDVYKRFYNGYHHPDTKNHMGPPPHQHVRSNSDTSLPMYAQAASAGRNSIYANSGGGAGPMSDNMYDPIPIDNGYPIGGYVGGPPQSSSWQRQKDRMSSLTNASGFAEYMRENGGAGIYEPPLVSSGASGSYTHNSSRLSGLSQFSGLSGLADNRASLNSMGSWRQDNSPAFNSNNNSHNRGSVNSVQFAMGTFDASGNGSRNSHYMIPEEPNSHSTRESEHLSKDALSHLADVAHRTQSGYS